MLGQSGELSGFVRDPRSLPVAGARLEFRNEATGVKLRARTNEEGHYSRAGIKPGVYSALVEATGFRTLTRSGIVIEVEDRAGLDFEVQLSDVSASITVTGEAAPEPMALGGARGTVVDQQFVERMPLNGRSFQSLIHVTPGVVVAQSFQEAPGQFSVNGQRTNTNHFYVDGVSASFGSTASFTAGQTVGGSVPALNILGGTNSLVSVEAMAEFRIETSSFAPEYGLMPGAQISIATKSGTNEWHGALYNYWRNEALDARNWFNREPEAKPPLRQNNFGGVLGGPLRRDRTFLFGSYEGLRLEQPATSRGDFLTKEARAKVARVYQAWVNSFPVPTGPLNADGLSAELVASDSSPARFHTGSLRLDHRVNDRLLLFGRYSQAPSEQSGWTFSSLSRAEAGVERATGGATMTISGNMVNEARANWSRAYGRASETIASRYGAVPPPESAVFPSFTGKDRALVSFSLGFLGSGISDGRRVENRQQQWSAVDTLTMNKGAHLLKFGVDFRRLQPEGSPLEYGSGVVAGRFDSLVSGVMNSYGVLSSDPMAVRMFNWGMFAQDTWRASGKLALTYGVRWSINTPPATTRADRPLYAVTGVYDTKEFALADQPLWSTKLHNLAPRVGAAYQVTDSLAVRGGFGVFHDLGYGAGLPLASNFPYYRQRSGSSAAGVPYNIEGPELQRVPMSLTITPTTSVVGLDPKLDLPYTLGWNVGVERRMGARQVLSAAYVGALGRRLLRQDLVIEPAGSPASKGMARVTHNADRSEYHGLQLQYLRRMSGRVQALASYTLGQSKDTGSIDSGLGSQARNPQSVAGSVNELRLPGMAPSDFDVRHALGVAVSWQMPGVAGRGWGWLRGWSLDGMARVNSGRPLNVIYQQPYRGTVYVVQPKVVAGQPFWIANANEPRGVVLNPKAFAAPSAAGEEFARNSLRGFPLSQMDVSLHKSMQLTERLALDVRVDYFNVLNHPMFANPATLWSSGGTTAQTGFGKVMQGNTLNYGLGGGGIGGGQAPQYAPGGPRSGQVSVKLRF